VWLFGPAALEKYEKMAGRPPAFTSVLLPASKYAVMRTGWDRNARYLLFDCAPWHGGHSHHDRLQVTVFAGRDLIIDSGMCSYDQPWQKDLRKSAAHNVVLVDGKEQPATDPQLLAWSTGPDVDFASGKIEGDGIGHQRSVLFVKPDYWVVVDHLSGPGNHEVTRLFHFPPGKSVVTNGGAQTTFPKGMNIRVQPVDRASVEVRPTQIAAGLVTPTEAPEAVLLSKGPMPMTLGTVLLPFEDAKQLPQVKEIGGSDPKVARVRVMFPDGRVDEISIGPEPMLEGSERALTQAVVRRSGAGATRTLSVPAGID
jgi:hypothetical protein